MAYGAATESPDGTVQEIPGSRIGAGAARGGRVLTKEPEAARQSSRRAVATEQNSSSSNIPFNILVFVKNKGERYCLYLLSGGLVKYSCR